MSGNGVRELAAAVEEIRARTNAVTEEAQAARNRLETLQTAIPEAVATGDGVLIRELRDERQNCELIIRDAEEGEKVLLRKLEVAEHELAVEQLPEVMREAETARDLVEATAERIPGEVQKYLAARRAFLQTRNRAHQGDGRPTTDIQPRSRIASVIIGVIRDSFDVQ